jgi:hypothetical protein
MLSNLFNNAPCIQVSHSLIDIDKGTSIDAKIQLKAQKGTVHPD